MEKPEPIAAKTLLGNVKQGAGNIFGLRYNMNLYRGCQHGCIYCDTRSTCYGIGELSHIRFKENALLLLDQELSRKRTKGTIGFGSMNDPYMPVEKRTCLTRDALKLVYKHRFPVHIITKSDLVVRDTGLLKKISETYAAVSLTITTASDTLSAIIEPGAPVSSLRFNAISQLSDNGIYCGITLMPILPFVNDQEQNIASIVERAAQNGAKYILPFMGMTLREGQREYFYQKLNQHFPGLAEQYQRTFGPNYVANSPNADMLYQRIAELCRKHRIELKMKHFNPPSSAQLDLFC
ncbi:MAG: radical SAM protein [Breznakibacter sp.]